MRQSKDNIIKRNFAALLTCVDCKTILSFEDEMQTDGVCPHCGRTSKTGVCTTTKIAARECYVPGISIFGYALTWVFSHHENNKGEKI
jgi:hypothetical protein